MLALLFL